MAWKIEVSESSLSISEKVNHSFIKRVAAFALSKTGFKNGTLSIGLVNRREMRKLNKRYRGEDKVTDVISLPLGSDKKNKKIETYWGEVVVCPSVAKKQAHLFKNTFREEIARLIVHGILHIAGYNHKTPYDAKRMFGLTDKIIKKFS